MHNNSHQSENNMILEQIQMYSTYFVIQNDFLQAINQLFPDIFRQRDLKELLLLLLL